jgi:hypothetical protein
MNFRLATLVWNLPQVALLLSSLMSGRTAPLGSVDETNSIARLAHSMVFLLAMVCCQEASLRMQASSMLHAAQVDMLKAFFTPATSKVQ